MFFIEVHSYSEMASFRVPETHTLQQTLPLPPKTALIGLVGAAVGLSFQEAMNFCCRDHQIHFGVIGTHRGKVGDLWKYRKIKSGETITAVLIREYLIDFEMRLYVGCNDNSLMNKIRGCFLDPHYVLTAGNSDLLLKLKSISPVFAAEIIPVSDFEYTMIPGNHSGNYDSNIDLRTIPLMRDIYAPQVQLLPVEFDFWGNERRVKSRQPFTFIDTPVRFKAAVDGFQVGERVVALI